MMEREKEREIERGGGGRLTDSAHGSEERI